MAAAGPVLRVAAEADITEVRLTGRDTEHHRLLVPGSVVLSHPGRIAPVDEVVALGRVVPRCRLGAGQQLEGSSLLYVSSSVETAARPVPVVIVHILVGAHQLEQHSGGVGADVVRTLLQGNDSCVANAETLAHHHAVALVGIVGSLQIPSCPAVLAGRLNHHSVAHLELVGTLALAYYPACTHGSP